MKAILKMTTVIAFMFIAAISMAKEPKLVLTAYSEAKMLVLELENVSSSTYIKFKDAQNNVIYAESVSNDLYSKKFNLNSSTTIFGVTINGTLKNLAALIALPSSVASRAPPSLIANNKASFSPL